MTMALKASQSERKRGSSFPSEAHTMWHAFPRPWVWNVWKFFLILLFKKKWSISLEGEHVWGSRYCSSCQRNRTIGCVAQMDKEVRNHESQDWNKQTVLNRHAAFTTAICALPPPPPSYPHPRAQRKRLKQKCPTLTLSLEKVWLLISQAAAWGYSF